MLREQTVEKLYAMKLRAMAESFRKQLEQPDMNALSFEERFGMVVDSQWLWRQNRAMEQRLKRATLKQSATLDDINYRKQRGLDRSQMRSLAACRWIELHQNILISGPAGVGKTYLCCALLDKACRQGYSASYGRAPRLFRDLTLAYADGSFDALMARLARIEVLAIDDFGLVAMSDVERRHLLEIIEDRHGIHSTIVASQFPMATWHDLIGNPSIADAILDRLTSGAHRIELFGESIRPEALQPATTVEEAGVAS